MGIASLGPCSIVTPGPRGYGELTQFDYYAESFINYNYEEINKICDPYWFAAYPDVDMW